MGKVVGDFGLYDGLLMGVASKYVAGEQVDRERIPPRDGDTEVVVGALRKKPALTAPEKEFLEYCDLLESLASALESAQ